MKEYEYIINGKRFVIEILSFDGRNAEVRVNGTSYRVEVPQAGQAGSATTPFPAPVAAPPVHVPSQPAQVEKAAEPVKQKAPQPSPKPEPAPPPGQGENQVVSPMPGVILNVLVEEGQTVQAGDPLLVLEAMKMENEIHAARAGTIKKILANKGTEVRAGTPLIEFD